jgi:hypothetical protein
MIRGIVSAGFFNVLLYSLNNGLRWLVRVTKPSIFGMPKVRSVCSLHELNDNEKLLQTVELLQKDKLNLEMEKEALRKDNYYLRLDKDFLRKDKDDLRKDNEYLRSLVDE